jgi:iron complex outermembrane recepter protein
MGTLHGLILAASGCLLAAATYGQSTELTELQPSAIGATPVRATRTEIEEVLVTARRREEPMQSTPIAVTAIGELELERLFINDLRDVAFKAPNVTIEPVGAVNRNAAVAYIRGIGYQGVASNIDPSVGISVDGVFFQRNVGALQDLFDIEYVEVLRGPQGTLFGKNTIGGVVNVRTRKPTGEYGARATVTKGNLGRLDLRGAVDFPIVEGVLAGKIAYLNQSNDGEYRNVYENELGFRPQRRLGAEDVESIRAYLRWTPSEQLTVDLIGTHLKDRSDSVGGQNASSPTDLLSIRGFPGYGFPGGNTDPFVVNRNFPSQADGRFDGYTVDARYSATNYNLVWITGYLQHSEFMLSDFDVSPAKFFETARDQNHWQLSQEFRVESQTNSRLQWVGGIYYSEQDFDIVQTYFLGEDLLGIPGAVRITDDYAEQQAWSIATFVQADYSVTDRLRVTVGGRYTFDKKDFEARPQQVVGDGVPGGVVVKVDEDWNEPTWLVSVDYSLSDDLMVYASYSTGFKSGGFNGRAATADALGPFDPEEAIAWEIGMKSDWFDRRLRLNLAAFWNEYEGLQIQVFQPAASGSGEQSVTANAAEERARGIELELTAIPMPNLTLELSVGYLDAEYTSFFSDLNGNGIRTDNTYLKPSRAPDWTVRVGASYQFSLGGWGYLTPDIAYYFEGDHYTETLNVPQGFQKGYKLIDASINYETIDGKWRVSLWGKNLSNEVHVLSAVPTAGLLTQLYHGLPRTAGVEIGVNL